MTTSPEGGAQREMRIIDWLQTLPSYHGAWEEWRLIEAMMARDEARDTGMKKSAPIEHGQRLELAKLKFSIADLIDKGVLDEIKANARESEREDPMRQAMIRKMEFTILAMDEDFISANWPRNWYQAFRERFLPKWWLRWFPVKKEFIYERRYDKVFLSVFPDKVTQYPLEGDRVAFHVMNGIESACNKMMQGESPPSSRVLGVKSPAAK